MFYDLLMWLRKEENKSKPYREVPMLTVLSTTTMFGRKGEKNSNTSLFETLKANSTMTTVVNVLFAELRKARCV